ncbi:deoR-like helix-turn-helix domain protein, partial [Vibrio parahaemolyticus V-223/04]
MFLAHQIPTQVKSTLFFTKPIAHNVYGNTNGGNMKTVDRILQIVKRDGSVTAKQLSSELGMTTMGARQHLQGLEDDGILSIHDVKVKVGRPTRH